MTTVTLLIGTTHKRVVISLLKMIDIIEGEKYIYLKTEVTVRKVYSTLVLLMDGRRVSKNMLEESTPQA